MSERLQGHRTTLNANKMTCDGGVQVVGNSQCSVAFREQYSLQVSLGHGQRRWRRDEVWQTVPHSRRGQGKGTVADSGQPRWRNDESGCWRRAQAPSRTEVGDTPEVVGEVRWRNAMETAVNENSELVYSIRCSTFSQCSSCRSNVTESYFLVVNYCDCSLFLMIWPKQRQF